MSKSIRRQRGRGLLFEALEDQVLYSADALGGFDAAVLTNRDETVLEAGLLPTSSSATSAHAEYSEVAAIHERGERHEIVFVDASVADYETLVQGFSADTDPSRNLQVVVLDANADGIEQMANALAELGDVDAVHIISHGNNEGLQLGSTWLSVENVDTYRDQLKALSTRLASEADLLLYGCELAASDEGIALIGELAALTGADVAASNDLTGSALLGGDWDLEHRVGTIESALAVSAATQQSWEQVLATYTVTTNAALGAGSLSDAIDQANTSLGVNDVIEFNIGGGGAQTIVVDATGLPVIIDTVTIDATTQPGYAGVPLITLDGSNTPNNSGINGFQVRADNSVIKGFRVHSFADEGIEIDGSTGKGDNNTIQNNWVGIDENGALKGNAEHGIMISEFAVDNQIGGTGPNEGNVVVGNGFDRGTSTDRFSGIIIQNNSVNNIVEGNLVGLMPDGDTVAGNGRYGIVIQNSSNGNRIGGIADGAENVVSGNTDDGIRIDGGTGTANNNSVVGNFIGTDAGGTLARGNGDDGISLQGGASDNTIGGTTPAERNIISGNDAAGVYIDGATTTGNKVQGNFIGTDVNGTADLGNGKVSVEGNVRTFNAGSNTIGGTGADDGNIIAFGGSDGVELQGTTQGIAVLRNSIFSNTGLAIDLNSDGADVNDGAKPGATPNLGMDTPVLNAASLSGATLNVSGYVGSAPGQALFANARVEIFKADATAGVYAQGQTFLGFLTTDANGNFSGALTVSGVLSSDRIVATATDAASNTSEFGAALAIDVNDAPVNTVPGTQSIERDGMLVFASAAGTAISVSDFDAGANAIEVTLTASNGTLTLASTQGLLFTTGDGADDPLLTFTGTISDINSALDGMNFTAAPGFTGAASVQILSDDLGSTGSGGAKTDTDLVTINVVGPAQSLWMTFEDDEATTGNPDIPSISGGDVVRFENITSLETSDSNPLASTTSGSFSYQFDLDTVLLSDGITPASDGNTRVDAVHRVASDISVGSNAIALKAGDLLLSTNDDEVLGGFNYKKDSAFVFRPDTVGDYSQGSFFLLIDGQAAATSFGNLTAITLVEQDTPFPVPGGTLNAGEFLVAFNNDTRDIARFTPGTLGATTTGSTVTLVEADDIDISQNISGLHLVQSDTTLGGVSLTAGQLLVTLESNDTAVGDTPTIDVKQQDVFVLDVTATGAGSSAATAHRLFEGLDENLNNNKESLWGVTLQSNAPPVFAPVAFAIDENSAAATPVGTVSATDPEGDSPRYAILAGNTGNAFAIDAASGQIVVANAAALDFETTPVFSLTVAAVDSAGAYTTATVTVNLNNVNEAPVIGGVDTGAVTEDVDPDVDTLLETAGALTIADPDAGESSFAVGTVNGTYGSLVIDSAGNWAYSADNNQAVIQALDSGETLIDTLTVTTFDGTPHDVVITINGAEDASVIGGTPTGTVSEDGTLIASDTLTITDVDTSDNPVSFNDEASTLGDNGYGNFEITAGTWTYTLNNAHASVQALDVGETLSDTHTFAASDGSTQVVTITIDGAEDASVIGGTPTGTVAEDGTLIASNNLTITDTDTSDNPVSFNDEASTLGDNGYGNFEITGNTWTYTLNNAHASVQALDVGETLSDTHTFTASDGSTQVVTITIDGAEDASIVGGTPTGTVAEDGTLIASNNLTITDTDTSDNPVSFNDEASTLGDNGYGNFEITGNSWTYTLNNAHASVQALDVGETLSDTHTFTASDGSTQVVTITINGAEDASVVGGTPTGTVAEDGTLIASNNLTITDTDTSDNPVTFNDEASTLGDNGFGNFEITGNTWTYTLNNAHASVQALDVGETLSDTHTFTASDGSTQVVTITIDGAEDASIVGGTPTGTVAEDGTLIASNNLTITDTDTSDNPVSFNDEASTLGDNSYGNFEITGNTWTYTLNNAHASVQALDVGETLSDTHTFTASDGSTQVVTITINGAEDASVVGGTPTGTVAEDGTLIASNNLTITDTDTSDNPVTFNNEASTLGDNAYGNFEITGNTWTYTLNNAHAAVQALDVGETLIDTHTFIASDGSTQVVTITINGAEDASVVGGTPTGTVAEDGTLIASNNLTITDTDTSDNPVTFNDEASTLGDNGFGNFEITGNTWTYTLNNAHASVQALDVGETMSDTHTFTASDGSTQVVTITIDGAEDASVVGGTPTGTVAEDGTLIASNTLTITDTDTSDNPVSFNDEVSTLGDNAYGNFEITGNTWTYTLNNVHASVQALDVGETLSDTHTFTASDGSTQVVTITINGAEDASVVGGTPTGTVAEDGTLIASNTLTITDTDTSDNPVSFNNEASTLGENGYGNFELTGNTWTYTLNNAHAAVQALDVGETLSDTHTFTASDGSTQVVTITINGAEDASVIGGTPSGAVAEDGTLIASNNLTITDTDTSDNPLSFNDEASTLGDNGYGNFEISGNTWTYTLNNAHASVQALDVGETLSDTHTFTASDGSTQVVTITIDGAEDASVIGGTPSGTVAEDGTLIASNNLTITDVDTSDNPLSFNDEASTLGDNGYGDFEITGNTWTYTLNNAHATVQALDVGETLSDTHTFIASDGSTQVVTITINGAEDASVIGGTPTGTVVEDGTLIASNNLTITDTDTSDNPVSFNDEASTLGDNGYGDFEISGNTWTYTLNNAHAAVQALDVGETLSDTHTFTASDGSTQVVTITIDGAEDASVIGGTPSGTVAEDGTLIASNTLTITDTDTSDNPVSFNDEVSTLGDNAYGNFEITGNTWTYTLNNAHASVQALDVGETLSDTHTFTASDGSTQVVTITINGAEDASVIGGTPTGTVAEDGTLIASNNLTITDTDTSDNPVSFNDEASTLGDNGYGNFELTGNSWTYTLNNAHAAVQALDVGETLSDTHTFIASDGSTQVVTITIDGAEDASVIGGTPTGTVAEDGTLIASNNLTITDADTNDNPVTFNNEASTLGDNGYGNFELTGNTWTYTLNNAHAAVQALDVGETLSDTHTFIASDGSTQVVTITINGAEDASVIGGTPTGMVAEDGSLIASNTLTITDTDTSDNPVSFNNEASTLGDNGYGNFELTGNTWTYTLNNAHAAVQALDVGETLSDTHTFTASDGSTQVVTITIDGAEDASVIGGTPTGTVAEDGTLIASNNLTITDTDTSDNPVSFNNEASTLGDNGYGDFEITGNTWTYTLNNAHAAVQALDVGETLSDTHTFIASDGSTQVVSITINGTEDASVIGGTPTGTVAEDGSLIASNTLTITDTDTSDNPVSFNDEASTLGDNGYGNFEITGNTWTYTLNNVHASVQALDVGETLSDTHTFTASDGSTQVVTITINGAEDASVVGGTPTGTVAEDGTLIASNTLTITDTDTSDNPVSFNNEASTLGDNGYGNFELTGNTWTYTLNNAHAAVQALDVGETLSDTHTFTASDGSTQVVTITIDGAEDASVIGGTPTGTVAEDGTLIASNTLTITDTDTSDNPVSFNDEVSTLGDNAYGNFEITGNTWTYTLNNAHASVQALDVGETLSDTHTFTASDGSTQVVTITINGAEDASVIGGTPTGTVAEDGTLIASNNLTITDTDTSDNPVSFNDEASTLGDNGYGNFELTGNTWTYTLNNVHASVQALDVGETLSDTHTFTASDGSTQVVTITINGAEDASVIGGTPTGTVAEDGTLIASNNLTITDTDTSDNPVSFNNEASTLGDNGYGDFEITGNTWTYTLNNAHASVQALDAGETLSDTHTFTASDGSTQVVTITIDGAEDASVIGGTATGTVAEDGPLVASDNLTITDVDTSDNPVSFNNEASTLGDNGYGDFEMTGNTWTFTLNNAHAAVQALGAGASLSDTHTFTASDGSTRVVTIIINGANSAPVIGGIDTGSVTEDVAVLAGKLVTSGALSIVDPDTGQSRFQAGAIIGTYGSLSIDEAGSWSYSADNSQLAVQRLGVGQSVTDLLTVSTADGATHDVTITISGAEDVDNNATDSTDDDPEPPDYEWLEEVVAVAGPPDASPPGDVDNGEPVGGEPNDSADLNLESQPLINPVGAESQKTGPEPSMERTSTRETSIGAPGFPDLVPSFQERFTGTNPQIEADVEAPPSPQNEFNAKLRMATQAMREEMNEAARDERFPERAADIALRVTGTALSTGSLAWLLRGASMFASALSAVPTWTGFDPLPVLAKSRRSREDRQDVVGEEDETETSVGQVLDSLEQPDGSDQPPNHKIDNPP